MAPSSKTTTGASAPSASVISAITSRVRLTAFDPEHVFLATVSADNRLRVVNASSAALVFEYQVTSQPPEDNCAGKSHPSSVRHATT